MQHEQLTDKYSPDEYPALFQQTRQWEKEKPLKGRTVLDATPVYQNTLLKHKALRAAFAHIRPCLGYAELTRSGIGKPRAANRPVFAADSSRIKRIETSLGTGNSYFRAMEALGYVDWSGKELVVFGSGKVGTGLIRYGYAKGALVSVITNPDDCPENLLPYIHSLIDFRRRHLVGQAIRRAFAVVTATGIPGAFEQTVTPADWQHSDARFANMGVEDEYGQSVPAERVLGGKKPLNFLLEEPTQLCYLEATMALHNEGARYLLQNPTASGQILPPAEMEEELLKAVRATGRLKHELKWIDEI